MRKFSISGTHSLFDSQLIYSVSTVNQLLLKRAVCSGKVLNNFSHPEGNRQWRLKANRDFSISGGVNLSLNEKYIKSDKVFDIN